MNMSEENKNDQIDNKPKRGRKKKEEIIIEETVNVTENTDVIEENNTTIEENVEINDSNELITYEVLDTTEEEFKVSESDEIKELRHELEKEIDNFVENAIIKEETPSDSFRRMVSKTPYKIYQHGIMICNYSPYINIKIADKYFEIYGKKYVYNGIEIKYA